jgi:hypothetical protein
MNKRSNHPRSTGELLRTLIEATATVTGDEFFSALVRHLATALEVRQTFVSELLLKEVDKRARWRFGATAASCLKDPQRSKNTVSCKKRSAPIIIIREK